MRTETTRYAANSHDVEVLTDKLEPRALVRVTATAKRITVEVAETNDQGETIGSFQVVLPKKR